MECNKEEADRAVQIALKKFNEKDILGAKRFALKAQKLFPELEGIHLLLETLNVHVSAIKVNGETDWYNILNVDPSASVEVIKKSYRRMLLMVHPDKNKWAGADEAFRLVTEAWNLLSIQDWRAAYDLKRKAKQTSHEPPITGVSTSTPVPYPSNYNNISDKNAAKPTSPPAAHCPRPAPKSKTQKGARKSNPKPQAGQGTSRSNSKKATPLRPDTFWTVCTHCNVKFEYERVYLNTKLICQGSECKKIFSAIEISPPRGCKKKSKKSGKKQNASLKRQKSNKFTASEDLPTSFPAFKIPQVPSFSTKTTSAPVSATATAELEKMTKNVLREGQAIFARDITYHRNGKRAGTCLQNDHGSTGIPPKRRRRNGMKVPLKDQLGNGGSVPMETEETKEVGSNPVITLDEVPPKKANEMLKQIAKAAIKKKLIEWTNTAAATSKKPLKARSPAGKGKKLKGSSDMFAGTVNIVDDPTPPKDARSTAMKVPEGDFHNFSDRTKWKFEKGQVWALYDDQYGMPRLYATVESVVSQKPFKVKLRWLHSESNVEFGPMEWIASDFHKTSGVFHRGQPEVLCAKSYFSHIVSCKRGSWGVSHIYPKKGDVWAVYKNWSPDWDASVRASADVFNQYDIMEVLLDYNEETGVTVAPLVKVPGFKAVLLRNSDPASHVTIPKHEIFRLSHQVPFCLLTEDNYPQAPRGCIEIDLAAVPYEFAQVIPKENSPNGVAKSAEQS